MSGRNSRFHFGTGSGKIDCGEEPARRETARSGKIKQACNGGAVLSTLRSRATAEDGLHRRARWRRGKDCLKSCPAIDSSPSPPRSGERAGGGWGFFIGNPPLLTPPPPRPSRGGRKKN